MRFWLALAIFFAPSLAQAEPVQLEKLEAFLIYSQTAKLSFDLLAPRKEPLGLWNTVIGEGDSGGAANDVLLVAHFTTKPDAVNQQPDAVSLSVKSETGDVLYESKMLPLSFIGQEHAAKTIILENVTCSNIDIVIKASDKISKATLPFVCAE